jgi:hypothetical protein
MYLQPSKNGKHTHVKIMSDQSCSSYVWCRQVGSGWTSWRSLCAAEIDHRSSAEVRRSELDTAHACCPKTARLEFGAPNLLDICSRRHNVASRPQVALQSSSSLRHAVTTKFGAPNSTTQGLEFGAPNLLDICSRRHNVSNRPQGRCSHCHSSLT